MATETQEKAFAAQLSALNFAMQQCGVHSRYLLMDTQRKVRIENVVNAATALLATSNAIDASEQPVDPDADLTPEPTSKELTTSDKTDSDSLGEPRFATEHMQLSIDESKIGLQLDQLQEAPLLINPYDQRVALRSSDESVVSVEDGFFIVRGVGEALLGATFYKDAEREGSKAEMRVALDLMDLDNQQDDETVITPDESTSVGFVRPSADFDLELELGKSAFVGKPIPLPLDVSNPDEHELEFESSDADVFEVDTTTGAILPKGAGDAILSVHVGDVKDDLMISIKG